MTAVLIVLFLLSAVSLWTPRAAQSRAEMRAAARDTGWKVVAPAGRHLAVQALLLLVEALHMIRNIITFTAQVVDLLAGQMQAAGTSRSTS